MEIKKATYQFRSYLGDNMRLVAALLDAAAADGSQTLVVAPCNAGKTYTVLKQIAESLPGRNLILLVPTVAQALQTLAYGTEGHPVHAVTGSNGYIRSDGRTTTATYDKAYELAEWDWTLLRNTTLVVDEAHMLVTEKSYRERAIRGVYAAAQSVLEAGGSVLYLTATPRRIGFPQFFSMNGEADKAQIIICEKTDEEGNPCPKILPKKLAVLWKPEKASTFQFLSTLLLANHAAGKRSLVLYNDKARIGCLRHKLEEEGVTSFRLTSDDKGFYQENIVDGTGIVRETYNVYVNEAYGNEYSSVDRPREEQTVNAMDSASTSFVRESLISPWSFI